jgi:hypothetical protein
MIMVHAGFPGVIRRHVSVLENHEHPWAERRGRPAGKATKSAVAPAGAAGGLA